jgi:hypothetical protein
MVFRDLRDDEIFLYSHWRVQALNTRDALTSWRQIGGFAP